MSVARPSHRQTARGNDYGKYSNNNNRTHSIHGSRAVGELEIGKHRGRAVSNTYDHIFPLLDILCNTLVPCLQIGRTTCGR